MTFVFFVLRNMASKNQLASGTVTTFTNVSPTLNSDVSVLSVLGRLRGLRVENIASTKQPRFWHRKGVPEPIAHFQL